MSIDAEIVNKALKPIVRRKNRYRIAHAVDFLSARVADKRPIVVTLRTGHRFCGVVDWFTLYDIGLVLENLGKVIIFRHALSDVTASESGGE
jgi:sRNA-binding regulator protein Hfq